MRVLSILSALLWGAVPGVVRGVVEVIGVASVTGCGLVVVRVGFSTLSFAVAITTGLGTAVAPESLMNGVSMTFSGNDDATTSGNRVASALTSAMPLP